MTERGICELPTDSTIPNFPTFTIRTDHRPLTKPDQTFTKSIHMRSFLFLLAVVAAFPAFSQKYSNEFLSIGVSARAQALGNSVVASVDDVTAGYWNPAGLGRTSTDAGLQLSAMHSPWFAGVASFNYLGVSIPFQNANRRLALSLVRFGIDNIPNTLSLYESDGSINYDNIVEFSAADYGLFASYGQQLKNPDLFAGGSVKVVRRTIGQFASSWGFGIDLGVQYHPGNWHFGAQARDLTTTFNAWKTNLTDADRDVFLATGNELPDLSSTEITNPSLIVGAGYTIEGKTVTITPEVNLIATTDGQRNTLVSADPVSLDVGAGVEVNYNDFLFLRAGVNQFQRESDFDREEYLTVRPSVGVGMQLAALVVDYAYGNLSAGDQNTFSHVISLRLDLKPSAER